MKKYVEAQAKLNTILQRHESTAECPHCDESVGFTCPTCVLFQEIREARNLLATAFEPPNPQPIPKHVLADIIQNECGDWAYWPYERGYSTPSNLREIAAECERRQGGSAMGATLALIERIRALAKTKGWAIGVHGSLIRDIDLIAVPWEEDACDWYDLYTAIVFQNGLWGADKPVRGNMANKPCGRLATIILQPGCTSVKTDAPGQWNPPAIDLSFMDPRPPFEGV